MNQQQVFRLLETNQNQRGIDNWNKMDNTAGLSSFGIGLTVLRKLAKKIGRNRELAQQLWASDCYDAKIIGLLIDAPKQITREQAEAQVEQLGIGLLTHVFSSCDATLAKSAIALDLALEWIDRDDANRKKSGYGLFYELSKKKGKRLTNELFLQIIDKVDQRIDAETKSVRLSMGTALMGIGKRSIPLNQAALQVLNRVGPIDFNEDGQKCEPMNFAKHLTSDYLKQKLGLS